MQKEVSGNLHKPEVPERVFENAAQSSSSLMRYLHHLLWTSLSPRPRSSVPTSPAGRQINKIPAFSAGSSANAGDYAGMFHQVIYQSLFMKLNKQLGIPSPKQGLIHLVPCGFDPKIQATSNLGCWDVGFLRSDLHRTEKHLERLLHHRLGEKLIS